MFQRITTLSGAMAALILGIGSTAGSSHPVARAPTTLATSDSAEIALGAALIRQFDTDRGVLSSPQSKRIEAYLPSIADSLGRHTCREGTPRPQETSRQWHWDEFGATDGIEPEKRCDYEGAKLMVQAGYSPLGFKTLLESYVALAKVHAPNASGPKAIVDRVAQIDKEIVHLKWRP